VNVKLQDILDYLGSSLVSFMIAYFYFLTLRDPGRNRITRFLDGYSHWGSTRWWNPSSRVRLWSVAIVAVLVGILGIVLFVTKCVKGGAGFSVRAVR
jgi:hypothetical protein